MSNATSSGSPAAVFIIRHGEKLGDASKDDTGGPDLSIQGSARATALPMLFAPVSPQLACAYVIDGQKFQAAYSSINLNGPSPRFTAPSYVFATQASKHSNRPVETITPLCAALNLEYDAKHSDNDYGKVASDILNNSKYFGNVVLVCWHHGNIPNLAKALGISSPPPWPGTVFDRIWQITYTNGPALQDLPQMLLYGDSST